MLHLLLKHLDKSFSFITNMFTEMLNYVKMLLYCNYPTLPALKGFSLVSFYVYFRSFDFRNYNCIYILMSTCNLINAVIYCKFDNYGSIKDLCKIQREQTH